MWSSRHCWVVKAGSSGRRANLAHGQANTLYYALIMRCCHLEANAHTFSTNRILNSFLPFGSSHTLPFPPILDKAPLRLATSSLNCWSRSSTGNVPSSSRCCTSSIPSPFWSISTLGDLGNDSSAVGDGECAGTAVSKNVPPEGLRVESVVATEELLSRPTFGFEMVGGESPAINMSGCGCARN